MSTPSPPPLVDSPQARPAPPQTTEPVFYDPPVVVDRKRVGGKEVVLLTRSPDADPLWPTMGTGGELVVDEQGCVRLQTPGAMDDFLLEWPPGFSLGTDGGELLVLDDEGQEVARVGEEIAVGGGSGTSSEGRGDVPRECRRGEYWSIRNVRASPVTPQVELVSENETATFFRYSRALDFRGLRRGELSGELALADGDYGKWHVVGAEGFGADYVPLWPPGHYARTTDGGEVEVLDGSGRVVARTGERVSLRGGEIPEAGAPRELERLPEGTTGCPGSYWVVR